MTCPNDSPRSFSRRFAIAPLIVGGLVLSTLGGCSAAPSTSPSSGTPGASSTTPALTAGRQQLTHHLTPAIASAPRTGRVPPSTPIAITLGLPVPDMAALRAAVERVSDPTSPDFRQYLTPAEFADAFGASPADYQAVVDWARSKNFVVTTHANRLVVDLSGTVDDVEQAFAVRMMSGQRPDGSTFHAPDVEPSLDLAVPVDHIGNIENFLLPRRADGGGSGPNGSRQGADFRHAYASCTTLTGTGQTVGIYMADGFSQKDVSAYFAAQKLPAPLTVEAIPAGSAGASAALEGDLDVQMVLSMAPGAQVVVFTGGTDTILSTMAEHPTIKQLSSSWFPPPLDAAGQAAFAQFALQGQSFFQASGDDGAYPSAYFGGTNGGDPRQLSVTVVGGTGLTMLNGGATYGSESTWPGSSGGILNYATGGEPIPSYQIGLANSANQASSVYRNLPDVSAEATDVNIYYGGGPYQVGGTSAATPLWAGFMALANEYAASDRKQSLGFINPTLYALAKSAYAADFNDITTGTNPQTGVPSHYYSAVAGYDLATGLGSPKCALIDALGASGKCAVQACAPGYAWNQVTCSCIKIPVCHTAAQCCAQAGGDWNGHVCE